MIKKTKFKVTKKNLKPKKYKSLKKYKSKRKINKLKHNIRENSNSQRKNKTKKHKTNKKDKLPKIRRRKTRHNRHKKKKKKNKKTKNDKIQRGGLYPITEQGELLLGIISFAYYEVPILNKLVTLFVVGEIHETDVPGDVKKFPNYLIEVMKEGFTFLVEIPNYFITDGRPVNTGSYNINESIKLCRQQVDNIENFVYGYDIRYETIFHYINVDDWNNDDIRLCVYYRLCRSSDQPLSDNVDNYKKQVKIDISQSLPKDPHKMTNFFIQIFNDQSRLLDVKKASIKIIIEKCYFDPIFNYIEHYKEQRNDDELKKQKHIKQMEQTINLMRLQIQYDIQQMEQMEQQMEQQMYQQMYQQMEQQIQQMEQQIQQMNIKLEEIKQQYRFEMEQNFHPHLTKMITEMGNLFGQIDVILGVFNEQLSFNDVFKQIVKIAHTYKKLCEIETFRYMLKNPNDKYILLCGNLHAKNWNAVFNDYLKWSLGSLIEF